MTGQLNVMQGVLKEALTNVSRAVSSRAVMPVLETILFQKEDDSTLLLAATNLEISIAAKVLASFDGDFQGICLPAKTVQELVGTFPNDKVSITIDSRTMSAKIVSGGSKSTVKGVTPEEFPAVQTKMPDNSINLPDGFADAVSRVVIATSNDEARPVLTGIFWEIKNGKMVLSAADGFRASRYTIDGVDSAQNISLIVPADSMKEYIRMSKGGASIVSLGEKGKAVFGIGDYILVSQVLEGNYPDLDQIIPKEFKTKVVVNSQMLKNATKQARIFSREGNQSTIIRVKKDGLVVDGSSDETGQTSTQVSADVSGDEMDIAFNAVYLADGLDAVKSPSITISLISPTSPGMFTSDENYLYLAMPMHIG